MPCRKENYIFLEQSVTVDSKEVDALVTKIGEALQLHNNNHHHHHHHLHHHNNGGASQQKAMSCLHGMSANNNNNNDKQAINNAGSSGGSAAAAALQRRGCCMRLRNRSHRSSRASPYHVPGSSDQETWGDQQQHMNMRKPWSKKRVTEDEDDDPHRLLQELILSGNLIKEAVRRLQFPAADCGDFTSSSTSTAASTDAVSC